MSTSFKEDIKLINKIDIEKLKQLKDIIDKSQKYICRGEVNIISNNNEVLVQTHYEYFNIYFSEKTIMITRCNPEKEIDTLDHTNISVDKITDYEINSTSLTLNGELDENFKIQILIVFKNKKQL
ncbi:hypothetical protein [Clostridium ganghwense]|uniref:DUF1934 domain-containing protein n=1 Tax=Clostridium ganghwense TaxID=312089 RepID=A0ABT4CX37_9CLOT|nr:hypothetical protein [Clostridium ganghwense]MCY6372449.1 hypothetical protein [Clostridium ganghwense]